MKMNLVWVALPLWLPATLIQAAPFPGPNEEVSKVYPDGLLIKGYGGTELRKLKFKDLPESVQRQYGYNPQAAEEFEREQARGAAEYRSELVRQEAQIRARQEADAREAGDTEQEKIAILRQIVADYRKSHTYSMADRFVCADMACDVWDMVKTKGLEAKIQVGNIERDITSVSEANHAWVLAETSSGKWLALETTAGQVIYRNQNPRYYSGWSFDNPGAFKKFNYGFRTGP